MTTDYETELRELLRNVSEEEEDTYAFVTCDVDVKIVAFLSALGTHPPCKPFSGGYDKPVHVFADVRMRSKRTEYQLLVFKYFPEDEVCDLILPKRCYESVWDKDVFLYFHGYMGGVRFTLGVHHHSCI